jgi:hypothetical protein
MAAFWAVHVFKYGGSVPTITAHGSLMELEQEIQIQI